MQAHEVAALGERLDVFVEAMTPALGRSERRRWARAYVAGLLLDGERKSIEPMAERLGGCANAQALQQFIAASPWACASVQGEMVRHAAGLWPVAQAWIIDETSFPKAGTHSVGVAHQYCGALGKIANCQVAVSLHYAGRTAGAGGHPGSAALGWRLLLPREWVDDPARRQKAGVPAGLSYASKNTLALELVEEALRRGLPPAPVLADSDYGDDYAFRSRLRALGLHYCVAVEARAKAWTQAPVGSPPSAAGRPAPAHPLPTPRTLAEIARALPKTAWRKVTWRQGTRGPMQSRFARVALWASHGYTQRQHQGQRTREWLFIEWPANQEAPTGYWLAHLGQKAAPPTLLKLASLAHSRWGIEQDYRECKEELGLDHFEGRGHLGWHHHVTLVCLAHLFLQSERLRMAVEATPKTSGQPAEKKSGTARRHRTDAAKSAANPARPARDPGTPVRPMSLVSHAFRHLVAT